MITGKPMNRQLPIVLSIIAVVAIVLLCFGAVDAPLMDPDEARFARTSLEMGESGNLVVPSFEGRPRVVKPPLLHWIQSFLFQQFGFREWLARLPAAVSTWISLWILAVIGWRRWGPEGAIWAPLIFITSPLVFVMGRIATLDALLAVHLFAAVAVDLLLPREHRQRGILIGLLLGMAFLAKGPIGSGLPLLIMLAGRTAAGRPLLPRLPGALKAIGGWAVVVLPWGLAFGNQLGWREVGALLDVEVVQRYMEQDSHSRPFWFYAVVLIVGFLPWILPLVAAIVGLIRRWTDPATATARYALAGLGAGTLLLSFSEGKLPSYFLPLAPLVVILIAWQVGQDSAGNHSSWAARLLPLQGLLLAVASATTAMNQTQGLKWVLWVAAVSFSIAALAGALSLWRDWIQGVYLAHTAAAATTLLACGLFLHPELANHHSSRSLVENHPEIRQTPGLCRVAMKLPSLTLYSGQIPIEVDLTSVHDRLRDPDSPCRLYVFDRRDFDALDDEARGLLEVQGSSGKYLLAQRGRKNVPSVRIGVTATPSHADSPSK